MTDEPLDLPELPPYDDRAVRRAMRRGVVRTALAAAAALIAVLMLVVATAITISALRGDRFFTVGYYGTVAAHPEYDFKQEGSCCAAGPLGGLTNLGLAAELRLLARPLGALGYPPAGIATVTQDVDGSLHTSFDDGPTPLRDAMQRGRPDLARTKALLAGLPDATLVSVLVEFAEPVPGERFGAWFDSRVPVEAVPYRGVPVFAVSPYESSPYFPVTWPNADLGELRAWAERMDGSYDEALYEVGLPPSAQIRAVAQAGLVHAFVLPRVPLAVLRDLAADPAVRSVNLLDTATDPEGAYPY
ncbi:hypothetical protein Cs7R123_62290 [Catellatospora sp. TT07R-123]|uniref:hypothetical protein n=1 Tax=Catellatospora sp. TT07R-123 TaxID=2733863 RepID=UPI001B2F7D17|nr:hypothetical protein [Catellatospora sp. TT07R-123]GHJ48887.1 hypothetical protein Cs7R123_62290 [Catellatospora sp. TT07R-123]